MHAIAIAIATIVMSLARECRLYSDNALTVAAKRVVCIHLGAIPTLEKILGQRLHVAQALQAGVHVARVAEVAQPAYAGE